MTYQFGDVVLVPFPFTDQSTTKQRPGVIVSSAAYNRVRRDVILMAITSQVRGSGTYGEIMVQDWQAAKLLKPSAIKPVRSGCFDFAGLGGIVRNQSPGRKHDHATTSSAATSKQR